MNTQKELFQGFWKRTLCHDDDETGIDGVEVEKTYQRAFIMAAESNAF
jgi:hypothetical protein